MQSVNLRSLRAKLPKGSIVRIAEEIGVSPYVISNVLNKNWYPQYHNQVLQLGIGILRSMYPDEETLAEANELGITGGSVFDRSRKKKVVRQSDTGSGVPMALYIGIIVLALFFLVPAFKNFVLNMWSKVTGRSSEAPATV